MIPQIRQVILAVTAVLALAVVCAVAWTPRPRAEALPTAAPVPASRPAAPAEPAAEAAAPPSSLRNVFEFVDRTSERVAPAPLPEISVPPPLAVAPMPPAQDEVRLVGFVRRGGVLRAVVSLAGNVAVLAAGEEADGYSVLAVDEDAGVTVRKPDGSEVLLAPSQP